MRSIGAVSQYSNKCSSDIPVQFFSFISIRSNVGGVVAKRDDFEFEVEVINWNKWNDKRVGKPGSFFRFSALFCDDPSVELLTLVEFKTLVWFLCQCSLKGSSKHVQKASRLRSKLAQNRSNIRSLLLRLEELQLVRIVFLQERKKEREERKEISTTPPPVQISSCKKFEASFNPEVIKIREFLVSLNFPSPRFPDQAEQCFFHFQTAENFFRWCESLQKSTAFKKAKQENDLPSAERYFAGSLRKELNLGAS